MQLKWALAGIGLCFLGCSASESVPSAAGESDGQNYSGNDSTGNFSSETGYSYGDGDGGYYDEPSDTGTAGGPGERFEAVGTHPFVVVDHDPLSTFAVDVDTASYDLFRSYVEAGSITPAASVRLEDFVNYFDYDYPAPDDDSEAPFAIHLTAAPNLATRDTRLLRVGIQGRVVEEIPDANVVFLIDVSGSMSQELPTVQGLLLQALDHLKPTDSVSIVTYAGFESTPLQATPVSERDKIEGVIAGLTSGGSTNGEGGITAAYAQAESVFIEDGINHIILCTDGDFNVGLSSTDEMEALVEEKRKSGITLTALGFGGGNFNDAMMERISNIGNGTYAYIGNESDADKYAERRLLQSLVHIAKDVKIQVEFNPEFVHAYRLLGYENRAIADDDFRDDVIDAGEIGSGHRVTALYELAFNDADLPVLDEDTMLDTGAPFSGSQEVRAEDLVLVKVRYKAPGASETDPAKEVSASLTPTDVHTGFAAASSDFQYAAAVATYAEVLKQSPFADRGAWSAIEAILRAQEGGDAEREQFMNLFTQSKSLLPE